MSVLHELLDVLCLRAESEFVLQKREIDRLREFLRQMVRRLW